MITAEEFKKRLEVINAYWKLMCKYVKCTGTDDECEKIAEDIDQLHNSFNETEFSKDIAISAVNELDRIMVTNGGRSYRSGKIKIVEVNRLIKELKKNGHKDAADFIENRYRQR